MSDTLAGVRGVPGKKANRTCPGGYGGSSPREAAALPLLPTAARRQNQNVASPYRRDLPNRTSPGQLISPERVARTKNSRAPADRQTMSATHRARAHA